MKHVLLIFLGLFFAMHGQSQTPANDECANAETISVLTASATTISVDFTEATESLDASCQNAVNTNKDVWFEFTMPIDGTLRINNTGALNFFSLYDSCGGAELFCGQDDNSFSNLINGNTYILRTSFQFDGVSSFDVQAITPIANDDCANAENISIPTTTVLQPNPNSEFATPSVNGSCDTANNTFLDFWYSFEMPVTGNLQVSNASITDVFTLYDACSGTELQCFLDDDLFLSLTAGTSYLLRVGERSNSAGVMNFRLQAFEAAINDECANATTILIETENLNTYPTDLRTATESLDATCETASTYYYDMWYTFNMPVSGNLKIDQLSAGNDIVTIYDACNGNELSCQSGLQFVSGLQGGTDYLMRVASILPTLKNPRFQAFEASTIDNCSDSETITVSTAEVLTYGFDTRGATESINGSCDLSGDYLDIWFEFMMPVNGNIQISNLTADEFSVLFDACGQTELDCVRGNGSFFDLVGGNTYKLRIGQRVEDADAPTLGIQAFEVLSNDECIDALSIVVETSQPNNYNVNIAAATESIDASCNAATITNLDVWYSFLMPVGGNLQVSGAESNQSYSLFDACEGNELQCFTNDGAFTGLISGQNYLLRVSEPESQAGQLSFTLQAFEVLSNDECSDATALTLQSGTPTEVSINLSAATESLDASCDTANNNNLDVWYSFIMPVEGNLEISNDVNSQRFTLFDSCGGAEIECLFGDGLFLGLNSGTNYLLRVAESDVTASSVTFNIDVLPQAVNDECDFADVLTVDTTQTTDYSLLTQAATESINGSCESVTDDNLDIWYTITMPVDGNLEITGAQNATTFSLYDSCGGNTDRSAQIELGCFSGTGMFENLTQNVTYIFRVSQSAFANNPADFSIQVVSTLGNNELTVNDLRLQSNPFYNVLQITNGENLDFDLAQLYDVSGRHIQNILKPEILRGVDVSRLQSGMYILVIELDGTRLTKRIIKQ